MNKNEIIIAIVAQGFSFTFDGDTEENRTIIFTKQGLRCIPILMKELSQSSIDLVINELKK